jgi:hypothetical protein
MKRVRHLQHPAIKNRRNARDRNRHPASVARSNATTNGSYLARLRLYFFGEERPTLSPAEAEELAEKFAREGFTASSPTPERVQELTRNFQADLRKPCHVCAFCDESGFDHREVRLTTAELTVNGRQFLQNILRLTPPPPPPPPAEQLQPGPQRGPQPPPPLQPVHASAARASTPVDPDPEVVECIEMLNRVPREARAEIDFKSLTEDEYQAMMYGFS